MASAIHPTAIIDPAAEMGSGVTIGPFAVIEADVEIGEDCHIGAYTRIAGPTRLGARNHVESHAAIGSAPQDLKYAGERTELIIGDDNTIREFTTFNRGTAGGGGVTRIGDRNLFMCTAHVAHDCLVGSDVIFANGATLAGHVVIEDHTTIGAFAAVHQFCTVGQHAFLGGYTVATKDCLPYMRTVGARPARCYGPNSIGLERKGYSEDERRSLKRAWRLLHSDKMPNSEAIAAIRSDLAEGSPVVQILLAFIDASKRGVIGAKG